MSVGLNQSHVCSLVCTTVMPRILKRRGKILLTCLLALFITTVFWNENQQNILKHTSLSKVEKILPKLIRTTETIAFNLPMVSRELSLRDLFISVKTSGKFEPRINLIIKTWFNLARNQTYFFTDTDNSELSNITGGHIINTGCKDRHHREDLSCKMAAEYEAYMKSGKKWWCHFDDDNYVNVPRLVKILDGFDCNEEIYLGKPSLSRPIVSMYKDGFVEVMFATGGAGLCVSSALAKKMEPWCLNGKFLETSKDLRLPDDCTLGFIIINRLGVNLTVSDLFHSHLEPLSRLKPLVLRHQVSFSYYQNRVVDIATHNTESKVFNQTVDPTRFLSIHCCLFPDTDFCV